MSAHCVYRMFDADGALVYVGCTGQLPTRLDIHRTSTPWWGSVASVSVEHFEDKRTALAAERDAIMAGNPIHNIYKREAVPEKPGRRGRPRVSHPGIFERWRDGESLQEIATEHGVTRQRVQQWIARDNPSWLIGLTRQLHLARTRTRRAALAECERIEHIRICRVCGEPCRANRGSDFPVCADHLPVRDALRTALNINGRYDRWRMTPSVSRRRAEREAEPNRRYQVRGSRIESLYREALANRWPIVDEIPVGVCEWLAAS